MAARMFAISTPRSHGVFCDALMGDMVGLDSRWEVDEGWTMARSRALPCFLGSRQQPASWQPCKSGHLHQSCKACNGCNGIDRVETWATAVVEKWRAGKEDLASRHGADWSRAWRRTRPRRWMAWSLVGQDEKGDRERWQVRGARFADGASSTLG